MLRIFAAPHLYVRRQMSTGDRGQVLNWFIGGYIAVEIFAYQKIVATEPALRMLFVFMPLCLLVWQATLLRLRLAQPGERSDLPFYERFETGDWWRLFWLLWIGHSPLASSYTWGFFLFSLLVALLIGLLVFTASVEYFRKKTATPLLIGCLAFGYFLLSWEKNMYVIHYGVPIVGHFFEKPEYDAKYRVEINPENTNTKTVGVADIHVEGRTETDDDGEENWLGQPITHTYTYRDVWVKKLYLPNGETITVQEQYDPLHLDESVFVKDFQGREWYVRLLNEPIH